MRSRMMRSQSAYLIDVVKRMIDLKGFIEREAGTTFLAAGRNQWKSTCPLHKDGNPSFSVTLEDDGVWVYHCFGCNSGGTIIDFCMELHCIPNAQGAAVFAAKKEGIKCDEHLISVAMKEARVKTDEQHETDLAHFVTCDNCRRLLRACEGDEETMAWVASAYKEMDKLLDNPATVKVSFEPFQSESSRRLAELISKKQENANGKA